MPLFTVDLSDIPNGELWIYYRKGFCDYSPKIGKEMTTKNEILKIIKEKLGVKEN